MVMHTLELIIAAVFGVSVVTWWYQALQLRNPDATYRQKANSVVYRVAASATANICLTVWLIALLVNWYLGFETRVVGDTTTFVSLVVATLIIQENRKTFFWKLIGYGFLVTTLSSLLSGCSVTPKPIDTVVPAGAVVTKVAVPTCGDDLAKSIFVVPQRPKVLPINMLTAADKEDYDKVSKAYQRTIQLLTEYAVALERNQQETQLQCKAIRDQVDTLNTKTPVISVQK